MGHGGQGSSHIKQMGIIKIFHSIGENIEFRLCLFVKVSFVANVNLIIDQLFCI